MACHSMFYGKGSEARTAMADRAARGLIEKAGRGEALDRGERAAVKRYEKRAAAREADEAAGKAQLAAWCAEQKAKSDAAWAARERERLGAIEARQQASLTTYGALGREECARVHGEHAAKWCARRFALASTEAGTPGLVENALVITKDFELTAARRAALGGAS